MYRTALQSLLAKFRRHSSSRTTPKRHKLRHTRLAIESLEGRQMMDGLGLKFEFTFDASVPANVQTAVQEAGRIWATMLSDDVTVNVEVGYAARGLVAPATAFNLATYSYSVIRGRLTADRTTTDDNTASSVLWSSPTFGVYINRTSDSPHGASSAMPYIDNDGGTNNSSIQLTTANAKALGQISPRQSGNDLRIEFSSDVPYDFAPNDGISAGQADIVGLTMHELAHGMGFTTVVNRLDSNPGQAEDSYVPRVLDLFRFSDASLDPQIGCGIIDVTADNREKFFQVDLITPITEFARGVTFGDGESAGHFRAGTSLLMDPGDSLGTRETVQLPDIRAMDVIGWDRRSTPWQNPDVLCDVTGDGHAVPLDALNLINRLGDPTANGPLPLPASGFAPPMWLDVNGDNYFTPLDALMVINHLNGQTGEGESSAPVIDWGALSFRQQNDVNMSADDIWFEFTTTRTGTLSLEALFSHAAGNVDLELYAQGSLSSPLASSRTTTNKERIDYAVSAGQAYYLRALGTNVNVDFLAGNLVALSGSTVDVVGTTGNDTFTFQAGSAHSISVNGLAYAYSSSSVNQVAFHGSSGSDTATVTGSAASESASLSSTSFTFFGQGYTVTGDGMETKRAYSGGGNDYAYLYDTSGNDTYSTQVGYSYMSGSGYVSYAHNFYGVYGYASSGFDRSYFYDSAGNDTFYNTTTYSYMSGVGFYHYAGGFDDAYGYAIYGGYDRAYFYDSSSNDYFYGRSNYAYMSGGGVYKYGSGFDAVYAYGYNGGINTSDVQSVTYAFFRYGTWV